MSLLKLPCLKQQQQQQQKQHFTSTQKHYNTIDTRTEPSAANTCSGHISPNSSAKMFFRKNPSKRGRCIHTAQRGFQNTPWIPYFMH
jgi:hypothetical protein